MAAGTDITHPVSALDGGYKPLHLEALPVCTTRENGDAVDNTDPITLEKNGRERDGSCKPPRPIPVTATGLSPATVRRCESTAKLTVGPSPSEMVETVIREVPVKVDRKTKGEYVPVIRSGGCMDIGSRRNMEDTHLRIDDLVEHLGSLIVDENPGAFYGVFDGHGGKDAAHFVREHILGYILDDVAFPTSLDEAVRSAFLRTDLAFAQACLLDHELSSGTTALTVLVFGRTLLVANAGDCRAVLSKRGKAVDMSRDHKPGCLLERTRIEAVGGYVDDGYLNGQLAVARALGDWHMQGLKELGIDGPLSAEPEMQTAILAEEDEFMIVGCDGLWDVFTSQNAVDYARKRLQQHNDPERCSRELVDEALRRNTCDNLTVVIICFSAEPPPRLVSWTPRFKRSISAEGLQNLQGLLDGCP